MNLTVHPFFDRASGSCSYLLCNPGSRTCAVIDPVLGYDARSRTIDTRQADEMIEFVRINDCIVEWILETHLHRDRPSSAGYLKRHFLCAQIGMGRAALDAPPPRWCNDADFSIAAGGWSGTLADRWFGDDERIRLGHVRGRVLGTPGHSADSVTYLFDNLAFVGDALPMPDGTGDPVDADASGDPDDLRRSLRMLYRLPDATRLLVCHDRARPAHGPRCAASAAEHRHA